MHNHDCAKPKKAIQGALALENGEAGMRMDIAGRKKLDFHPPKEYKPYFKRGFNLKMTASGFGLDVKPVNKYDYSKPHLLKK